MILAMLSDNLVFGMHDINNDFSSLNGVPSVLFTFGIYYAKAECLTYYRDITADICIVTKELKVL